MKEKKPRNTNDTNKRKKEKRTVSNERKERERNDTAMKSPAPFHLWI
jgi:hypothetical protein